jgi:lipoyl(octanoyl) transferase
MKDTAQKLEDQPTCAPQSRWRNDVGPVEIRTSARPVAYPEALAEMDARVEAIGAHRAPEQLWLLEHPPLYTAGTSANAGDLLAPDRFPVFQAGRGGQYTYHGPGQRVGYVMLDLKGRAVAPGPDIRCFVHDLEEWLIGVIARFGVKAERREGRIGLWVADKVGHEKKIAALGIRVRRWISFHGVSLNVNPDLSHFTGIVPCGISQHGVTSLYALGVKPAMAEVDAAMVAEFKSVFGGDVHVTQPPPLAP